MVNVEEVVVAGGSPLVPMPEACRCCRRPSAVAVGERQPLEPTLLAAEMPETRNARQPTCLMHSSPEHPRRRGEGRIENEAQHRRCDLPCRR
nr:hypothetical protein Itr_chr02CG14330 [Ipomoea trifida]GLL31499.1 hypothetical protein Itr_chr07CG10510 [Ipomoea trifida]